MDKKYSRNIAFISAKGGSGKTILTATIGKVLSELGKKVLIIDADAATNGLSLFYLSEVSNHQHDQKGLRGLFDPQFFVHKNVFIELDDNLSLLPATYEFRNTLDFDFSNFNARLIKLIEFNNKNKVFDYILIDNQAGSEHFTEAVIKRPISDEILIVSEYDPISAAGIERLKGFFNNDLTYDRTWVVLNKVLPEFNTGQNSFLEISKYLPPQIWNSDVVRSYARKEIPVDFKYGNEFTLSIIKLLKTLFGKSLSSELDIWLSNKEQIIKKPIFDEYAKLKHQLMEYSETSKGAKLNYISILYALIGNISALGVIYFSQSMLDNSFLQLNNYGFITIILILIGTSFAVYFVLQQLRKKNKKDDLYKYEKEALVSRIKELELLKQLSVEEILAAK